MKAFIDLSALLHNLSKIQQLAASKNIIAMVKANAYGHGLVPVARFLESQGVNCFGVAMIEEGESLRAAGIQSKILLMSGAGLCESPERIFKAQLTPLISSIAELEALNELNKEIAVHIDLDTGMSRGGFTVSQVDSVIKWFAEKKRNLQFEGLSTHFANAETPDCAFSKTQLEAFEKARTCFEAAGFKPSMIHVAKSSAIVNGIGISIENSWVRPGIALYGGCEGFEPVMSLKAPVTLVKILKTGDTVGYDRTWRAPKETRIALIRAGYGDGIPRELSNTGQIVGRVSMDLLTLDMTGTQVQVGDWMMLMSIQEMAQICDTISYEILTRITERVERVYK